MIEPRGRRLTKERNGTHITGNSNGGMIAFSSGALQVQNALIDNNSGNGITVAVASSANIQGTTITNNGNDGISILDTSVVQFEFPNGSDTVTNNGAWGVRCDHAPSVAMIRFPVGTVTGNHQGQIDCPTA
jgi:hypothetical protein